MTEPTTPAAAGSNEAPGRVEELAHRIAWRYAKSSDPHHSDTYTFNRATLLQFAGALEAAERERWAPLLADLRHLADKCEWPDGDGAQVIAQLWAEEWVRRLTNSPNGVATGTELLDVVAQILDAGHMNTEDLARLRAAFERA